MTSSYGENFGLQLRTTSHPDIRRLKQDYPTSLHGNKLWSSAFTLMDYIGEHPPQPDSYIVEPGCGWGLPGIFCARHFGSAVTAIDADANVFPYLSLHADLNNVEISTQHYAFEQIQTEHLQGYDWLIAADICFWDEMADPVFALIERACDAGVKKIIIADPQRPPFFEMAERCIESFYGELEFRKLTHPKSINGALLIIENA